MIIAQIAGRKFVLESLKDAEALMNILDRSTPVESAYDTTTYVELYYESSREKISITIDNAKIVSQEEAIERSTKKKLQAVEAAA